MADEVKLYYLDDPIVSSPIEGEGASLGVSPTGTPQSGISNPVQSSEDGVFRNLLVKGFLTTYSANIGGLSINGGVISTPLIVIDTNNDLIKSSNFITGSKGWRFTGAGNLEAQSGFFRGDITGASGTFSGTITATVGSIGGWSISSAAIYKDGATDNVSSGLAPADYPFYAGKKYADRATAPYRITPAGHLFASSATVSGAITAGVGSSLSTDYISGIVAQTNLNIANQGWTQTCAFSSTDLDTVSWGAGSLITAGGTTYSIGAGNTGNMSARTYIYLDLGVSTTAFQTTTTAGTAVGIGKVLVATAINGATEATFEVFGGVGGAKFLATDVLVVNSIVASLISVSSLSALSANLGIITAGTITLDSSGYIRGGQTAYNTGTGFWEGYSGGVYKKSIGDGSNQFNQMLWDGTNLIVNGSIIANQDKFGDGSDGDITISADTTLTSDMYYNNLTVNATKTLNTGGYRIFVKGTLTNNGTIARNGNAGGNGGNATTYTSGQGAAGTAGAALADGSIKGALAGIAGVAGVSGIQNYDLNGINGNGGLSVGVDVAKSLVPNNGIIGKNGGKGGNATVSTTRTGGTAGVGLAGGSKTGIVYNTIKNAYHALLLYDFLPSGDQLKTSPSNGGGGSGGSGAGRGADNQDVALTGSTGGSGGGGGQGGIVCIFAKIIINSSGVISANGGAAGNAGTTYQSWYSYGDGHAGHAVAAGGSGGSSGGVGGNGGILILIYQSLTAGTETANGAAGGSKSVGKTAAVNGGGSAQNGDDGIDGVSGNAGIVIKLQV